MSEGELSIKIGVDDRDSIKLLNFGRNVEQTADKIKTSGKSIKSTTELFGSLANFAGGSQIGSFAGQIGQITEKFSQFSDMAKGGAGGLGAMKAGMAGIALVAGYEVGSAIGNWAFGVEETNKQLERSRMLMKDMADQASKMSSGQHADRMMEFEFIKDPEDKTAAMEKYFKTLKNNAAVAADEVRALEKKIRDSENAWSVNGHAWFTGNAAAELENMKASLEVAKNTRDQHEQQRDQLKAIVGVEEQRLAKIKEQWAAQEKSTSYVQSLREELAQLQMSEEEKARNKMMQNTVEGDRGEAAGLLKEIEAEKERLEIEKQCIEAEKQFAAEKEKAQQKEIANTEKLNKLYTDQVDTLEKQFLAAQKGDQAAVAFGLKKQGLAEAEANERARIGGLIGQLNAKDSGGQTYGDIQARESRIMVGRGSQNVAQMESQKRSDEAKIQAELLRQIKAGIDGLNNKEPIKVEHQTP